MDMIKLAEASSSSCLADVSSQAALWAAGLCDIKALMS